MHTLYPNTNHLAPGLIFKSFGSSPSQMRQVQGKSQVNGTCPSQGSTQLRKVQIIQLNSPRLVQVKPQSNLDKFKSSPKSIETISQQASSQLEQVKVKSQLNGDKYKSSLKPMETRVKSQVLSK